MKRGFTLVEVLVAVLIISVVGVALLKMRGDMVRSLSLVDSRMKVNRFSSFIFGKVSKKLHGKNLEVYEYVKERYNIKDDDLIHYLKSAKYEYRQDEIYFLHFGENSDSGEDGEMADSLVMDTPSDKEVSDEVKREGVLVERVMIRDENNNSTSIYHFSFLK
ncbi:MAG TPA: type II secretion system protein [Campylobacterales bacterium]|nr:type II secretion system protein [Campylobacterales bacterium]HIO70487.1 type II secretion system protein [Campylobacterales bacterium]